MIVFKPIHSFQPGQIQNLIKICYKDLIEYYPCEQERFYCQWEYEDDQAFQNMDTIGKNALFTCLNDLPIGYFSWNDRQYPSGFVGQNCILPKYQRRGYGRSQIEMIKKIFRDNKFETIIAATGNHEFFKPSQKMYEDCGFVIHSKRKGELFEIIEYIAYPDD